MSDKSSEENLQDLPPKFKVIFLKMTAIVMNLFSFLTGLFTDFTSGGGGGAGGGSRAPGPA